MPDKIIGLLHDLIYGKKHGLVSKQVAAALSTTEVKLSNKLNANQPSKFTVEDLAFFLAYLGREGHKEQALHILNYLAAMAGLQFFHYDGQSAEVAQAEDDMTLLDRWANWDVARGRIAEAIQEALRDHKVSPDEYQKIRNQMEQHVARELELIHRLENYSAQR